MKNWTKAHMRKVRAAIIEAMPDARFVESDYGYGLSVANASMTKAIDLFWIDYDTSDPDNPQVIASGSTKLSDVPLIVSSLKAP